MAEDHLLPGRSYLFKTANRIVPASISELKYKINVNNQDQELMRTQKKVFEPASGSELAIFTDTRKSD